MYNAIHFYGTWGVQGGWGVNFFPESIQIWCVSYSHECHMQGHNFFVPAPWCIGEGPKGQI